MASTKDVQEQILANMKRWQKIENQAVAATGHIIEKTKNPLIRQVMEIIQADSQRHYHVQQMIVDCLEREGIALTPEDLGAVWTEVEKHIELERKTVEYAHEALKLLKGKKMVVIQYLIEYLLEDENKHNKILDNLEGIKKGMYPYG